MTDITNDMIERGVQAMRDAGFVDWDDDTVPTFFPESAPESKEGSRINVWAPPHEAVRAALEAALAGRVVLDLPAVKREDEDGRYYYVETPTGCVQGSSSRGGEGEQPPWFRVNHGKWLQVLGERQFAAAIVAVLRAADGVGGGAR